MPRAILVLNTGSSSIKFALYRVDANDSLALLYRGKLDQHVGDIHFRIADHEGQPLDAPEPGHPCHADEPPLSLLEHLEPILGDTRIVAVGHRIVHGGVDFVDPVAMDEAVLAQLQALSPLAPLHQPVGLAAVHSLLTARPGLLQVACFDTAFHHGMPAVNRTFALPDLGPEIRRYGFHGLSFSYIASQLKPRDRRTVVAHLGSGSSVCALLNGKSIHTSMSFTPLDGLMMATRSGAIDPALVLYLQKSRQMSVEDVEDLLYRRSGLLGVSGRSADMRVLLQHRDAAAGAAIEQFCARAAENMATMITALGGCDTIVFTGGVGENSPEIRSSICARLNWIGAEIDHDANFGASQTISTPTSRVAVVVKSTNEEIVIARGALLLLTER